MFKIKLSLMELFYSFLFLKLLLPICSCFATNLFICALGVHAKILRGKSNVHFTEVALNFKFKNAF